VRSANGLLLQEMDVVEIGGNKYLAIIEGKRLVVKRYDKDSDSCKYLYTWTGLEKIIRDPDGAYLLQVAISNRWF
jgi:hypothetical protein